MGAFGPPFSFVTGQRFLLFLYRNNILLLLVCSSGLDKNVSGM